MYRIRIHGRGGQGIKMASRVLVRVWFRRTDAPPEPFEYRVGIERDGASVLRADGPAWRGQYDPSAWASGALVEDSRVFKVYPKDRDAHVIVEVGDARIDLGPVGNLAVAP